jgi:uncharacterized membrane protein
MDSVEQISQSDFTITARPNCSLSGKGRWGILVAVAAVSFGIAAGFAWVGAWLVLPFAGLEILLFGLALHVISRSAGDYEYIAINGNCMRLEQRFNNRTTHNEFQCYWAQVILQSAALGGHCRLFVRSHGKQVEVGRFMSDEQRIELASQLKQRIGRR